MNASTSPRALLLLSIALGGYAASAPPGGHPLTHAALAAHGTGSPTVTEASFRSGRTRDSVTDGTHTWTGQLGGRSSGAEVTRTGYALRALPTALPLPGGDTHFGFKHDPLYVRNDEDDLEARVRTRGAAGLQSTPIPVYSDHDITADREAVNAEIVRLHTAKADDLKKKRDSEEQALCQANYAAVVKSGENGAEETRLAPDVTFRPQDDDSADPRRVLLGQRVEHADGKVNDDALTADEILLKGKTWLWKPAALTRAQFQTIDLGNTMVVDRDDETYDYLAASGTVGKMTSYVAGRYIPGKDRILAEQAHEFFWRRAPAQFDVSNPRLLAGDAKAGAKAVAEKRGSDMRIEQAGAHAYTHAKMIKLRTDAIAQPTTSNHFRMEANKFRITQDVWEAEKATITDAARIQIANRREADYKAAQTSSFDNKARDVEKRQLVKKKPRIVSKINVAKKILTDTDRVIEAELAKLTAADTDARDQLRVSYRHAEKLATWQAARQEYKDNQAAIAALDAAMAAGSTSPVASDHGSHHSDDMPFGDDGYMLTHD